MEPIYIENSANQYVRPDAGGILLQYGLVDEAFPFVEKSMKEMPTNPKAIGNYAIALTQLGKLDEALGYYVMAEAIDPNCGMLLYNHACALEELGRFDEAFGKFTRAYELTPTHKGIMHGYAVALLRQGKFAEAWPLWDHTITKVRIPELPNWHGPVTDAVAGKRFLVLHEGGFGDMFMFWRFLKQLKDAGAHVTYYGLGSLKGLLGEHPYIDRWLQTPDPIVHEEFDFQTGGMRVGLKPWTEETPIIKVDAGARLDNGTPRVGLCWDSGEMHAQGRKIRAMELKDLEPLRDCPVKFVSLQYGAEATQWMQDTRNLLSDWRSTAELAAGLDLVISVDTAMAHLAGSIGAPTWTLLPVRSDWRWGREAQETAWYPGMKLYRNTRVRDWSGIIEQVATDLNVYRR